MVEIHLILLEELLIPRLFRDCPVSKVDVLRTRSLSGNSAFPSAIGNIEFSQLLRCHPVRAEF